jgi:hypothetical protein
LANTSTISVSGGTGGDATTGIGIGGGGGGGIIHLFAPSINDLGTLLKDGGILGSVSPIARDPVMKEANG